MLHLLATAASSHLESLGATARAPGAYALTIKTAQCELVIRFEPAGVRVESLEVG